jgi:hypothetical protein
VKVLHDVEAAVSGECDTRVALQGRTEFRAHAAD